MLSYQLGSCITAEGTAGSPSPPRGRRAISFHPIAGTCLVAAANPKTNPGFITLEKRRLMKQRWRKRPPSASQTESCRLF